MKHLFVNYKLALQLHQKKFDENCIAYYNVDENPNHIYAIDTDINFTNFRGLSEGLIKAPMYQQVIDWFRLKHNIIIQVSFRDIYYSNNKFKFIINIYCNNCKSDFNIVDTGIDDYYENLIDGITDALKLI